MKRQDGFSSMHAHGKSCCMSTMYHVFGWMINILVLVKFRTVIAVVTVIAVFVTVVNVIETALALAHEARRELGGFAFYVLPVRTRYSVLGTYSFI